MKIAAVAILFNPDHNCLPNIQSYYDAVEKIYVFDNTENSNLIAKNLITLPKISYHQDGENKGLSKRLNEACESAIKDGFDWLLTMDQDSIFFQDSFAKYINCFSQYKNKEAVGMFATTNTRIKNVSLEMCDCVEDFGIITSGTLLSLKAFKKIGEFDEALFIDCVDHDYCIRTYLAGYKIIRFTKIFLLHELGREVYRSSIKTLFLHKKKKEIHSPLRCYYMFRNIFYLAQKFKKDNPGQIKQIKKDVFSRILKAIFYGRNTIEILINIKRGYKDYKEMKMGKFIT